MLSATCHCGAVRVDVPGAPQSVVDCNCSICRRYGALWAFYPATDLRVSGHPASTTEYVWGPKTIRTLRCTHCGCVTHWEPLLPGPDAKFGVNMRNFDPATIASARVRRFDGADTWTYID